MNEQLGAVYSQYNSLIKRRVNYYLKKDITACNHLAGLDLANGHRFYWYCYICKHLHRTYSKIYKEGFHKKTGAHS